MATSQSAVLEFDRRTEESDASAPGAAPAAGAWSARRKLLCVATLGAAAWIAVLLPLLLAIR